MSLLQVRNVKIDDHDRRALKLAAGNTALKTQISNFEAFIYYNSVWTISE